MIESAARKLAMELVGHRDAINRELSRNGVRFGIYQNGTYHDRLFPYDPIPRIIESDEFDDKAPLAKLANYLMPLQGLPVPQCFAEGLRWLVGQLPQRGYGALADKLGVLLDDFDGRISTKGLKDLGMLNTVDMDAARI